MSNIAIILIILAAMIIAAPVAAQPGAGMSRGQEFIFRKMDTNRDGTVDQQEYQAAMQERFNQTDANHDGVLTQEEMAARMTQLQELRRMRQQGGGAE
ncbi:EF-hand domain-containing protein [Megalodesulfovibrio gigas]|uniref:Putative EF hand repeat-containing protein n=1 Tax=Megalodesulfovibrio gigas (strain ATCC 19364 / DSM 1382 / NCIMB 9332 / VKM B-1759) TaxID=1121448 RepID=T2G9B8_MEGG1|nr:EF-hand domain-containing protein [Megalodesulfovibrio gigas]AGW12883.1 putative EF hand repeat-containing protein [Megalodesulfovibrio gigas DSM 1382 = ATCC 19364]